MASYSHIRMVGNVFVKAWLESLSVLPSGQEGNLLVLVDHPLEKKNLLDSRRLLYLCRGVGIQFCSVFKGELSKVCDRSGREFDVTK